MVKCLSGLVLFQALDSSVQEKQEKVQQMATKMAKGKAEKLELFILEKL